MPSANTKKATNSKVVKKTTKKSNTKKVTSPVKLVKKTDKTPKVLKKKQTGGNKLEEVEEVGKRYFKCLLINENGNVVCTGRYSGKKPKQAASKACTRLYDTYKDNEKNMPANIVFGMHECTRKSKKKKKYFYTGSRVKLENPEEVTINKLDPKTGKKMVIRYYYNNNVKKLTNVEDHKEYKLLCDYDSKDLDVVQLGGKKKVAKKATKKTTKKVVKNKKTSSKTAVSKKTTTKKNNLKVVKKNATKKNTLVASKKVVKKNTNKKAQK